MACEGGGEDEGGEGDAVGYQDERKEPPSAWTHSPKLISYLFRNNSCICSEIVLAFAVC